MTHANRLFYHYIFYQAFKIEILGSRLSCSVKLGSSCIIYVTHGCTIFQLRKLVEKTAFQLRNTGLTIQPVLRIHVVRKNQDNSCYC